MSSVKVSELSTATTPYDGTEYSLGIQDGRSVKVPVPNLAGALGATLIGITPNGTISSTTVATALNELDSEKASVDSVSLKVNISDLAATTGSSLVGFQQIGSTTTRAVDTKLKESISVLDFGADPTGVVDSSSAIQEAINSTTIKEIYFPSGTYLCTSTLTISNPITLAGESVSNSILKFSGCDGIVITHNGSPQTSNTIKNISITTVDSGLYTGLSFTSVESPAWKKPRIVIEHVSVSGYLVNGVTLNEWLTAVYLISADDGYINDLVIKGKETAATSGYLPATIGLYVSNSTTMTIKSICIFRVKTAFYLTGQSEGLMLTDSTLVAVYSGVVMEGLATPANNHQIHNVHISASYEGLRIDPMTDTNLSSLHFFSNIFFLKRTEDGLGGLDGYKAVNVSIATSTFNNVTTQTNYASKDNYAVGDVGFLLKNGSINNSFTNITIRNPGLGFSFLDTSGYNIVSSCNMIKGSIYTQVPFETLENTNYVDIFYQGFKYNRLGSGGYDWKTTSGTTLRVNDKIVSVPIVNGSMSIGLPTASGYNYFDFNTSGFSNDYDVRLYASGGTSGVSGDGNLQVYCSKLSTTGHLGVGATAVSTVGLLTQLLLSSTVPTGTQHADIITAGTTSNCIYNQTLANSQNSATAYIVPNIYYNRVNQGTFGTNCTVTNQYGFSVASDLISASLNVGFHSILPITSGKFVYNCYMVGTAPNYFAGNVSIGVISAGTGTILDVQSTTAGVRFPNMTTTQKNAITPALGTVIYDTTLNKLCVYVGSWQTITSV